MSLSPLEIQVQTLPESAGVYQYFDADGQLIYVGKAKNIKKRVKSYFTKHQQNGKTRALVRKIDKVSHIVVASEKDDKCPFEVLFLKIQKFLFYDL